MQNILITGATGALGRAVVQCLQNQNCYNIFTTSRQHLNTPQSIKCDVRDKAQIIQAIEYAKPDIVLPLAVSFANDLNEAAAVNVLAVKHILDYIVDKSLSTRVVLIGSAAEYGILQPEENPVSVDRVLTPISTYGVTKAWQTQLMSLYTKKVDVLCARIFNFFGDGLTERSFAGRLQKQIGEYIAGARSAIELGSLSHIRDYISSAEAAAQLHTVIRYGQRGKIYHVASGIPVTIREFTIKQLLEHGLSPDILQENQSFFSHISQDVPVIYADITSTKELNKEKI